MAASRLHPTRNDTPLRRIPSIRRSIRRSSSLIIWIPYRRDTRLVFGSTIVPKRREWLKFHSNSISALALSILLFYPYEMVRSSPVSELSSSGLLSKTPLTARLIRVYGASTARPSNFLVSPITNESASVLNNNHLPLRNTDRVVALQNLITFTISAWRSWFWQLAESISYFNGERNLSCSNDQQIEASWLWNWSDRRLLPIADENPSFECGWPILGHYHWQYHPELTIPSPSAQLGLSSLNSDSRFELFRFSTSLVCKRLALLQVPSTIIGKC